MRTRIHLGFSHWTDEQVKAEEIIAPLLYEKAGYPFKYTTGETTSHMNGKLRPRTHHDFDLFADDERYRLLKYQLDSRRLEYLERGEKVFDEDELAAAEFLYMGPAGYWGYPQPESSREEWEKASFDVSTACPICGHGAIQDRPYLIKGEPKFGRNNIIALNWTYDFLVTEELKNLIDRAGLTGAEFWPLVRYKKGVPLNGFHELYIKNELPPMSPNTEITAVKLERVHDGKPCPYGKAGLWLAGDPTTGVLAPLRYKRSSLKCSKDFNLTHEWLSGGYDPRRLRIASSRVYDLFAKHNIQRVHFEPVIIEDD